MAYEGLLLPVQFARKESEGHGYGIEEAWNWKQLLYVGLKGADPNLNFFF